MAQDLAHDLIGSAIIGPWAGLFGGQSGKAAFVNPLKELIVALAGLATFLGELSDVGSQALAFYEHDKMRGLFVIGTNSQRLLDT